MLIYSALDQNQAIVPWPASFTLTPAFSLVGGALDEMSEHQCSAVITSTELRDVLDEMLRKSTSAVPL